MTEDVARRLFEWLKRATDEEIDKFVRLLTLQDALALDAWFEVWAHKGQLPPQSEGWRVWLMLAGRGFGKTRAGAEWIYRLASGQRGQRIALVGASIADARSIMVEGVSGLLAVAKQNRSRLLWEPSLGRLKWPNGSEAQLFSGDHADGLRGPEHTFAWCASNTRYAGGSCRRGRSASISAGISRHWRLLHRRCQPNRRVGGKAAEPRCIFLGRMAIYRADRGHDCLCSRVVGVGGLSHRRLGAGHIARLKRHHRRSTGNRCA